MGSNSITSTSSHNTFVSASEGRAAPRSAAPGGRLQRRHSAPAQLGGSLASARLTPGNLEAHTKASQLGEEDSMGGAKAQSIHNWMSGRSASEAGRVDASSGQKSHLEQLDEAQAGRKQTIQKLAVVGLGGAFLATTFLAVALLCPVALIFVAPVTVYGAAHLWKKTTELLRGKRQQDHDILRLKGELARADASHLKGIDDDAASLPSDPGSSASHTPIGAALQAPSTRGASARSQAGDIAQGAADSAHSATSEPAAPQLGAQQAPEDILKEAEDKIIANAAHHAKTRSFISESIEKMQQGKLAIDAARQGHADQEARLDQGIERLTGLLNTL